MPKTAMPSPTWGLGTPSTLVLVIPENTKGVSASEAAKIVTPVEKIKSEILISTLFFGKVLARR
ncbi:MAG: hypothetical protein Q7R65_01860 [bacterium]|nr:hypothetical protein [bacterium]